MSAEERALMSATVIDNQLFTISDLAEYLKVSVRWIEKALQQKSLPCQRFGTNVRFTPAHVLEILAAFEERPEAEQPARELKKLPGSPLNLPFPPRSRT